MSRVEKERETAEVRRARIAPAEARPESYREPYDEATEIREYLDALRKQWRLIAAATLAAMLVTAIVTKFGMTRWYRAEAIIRPVTENAVQGRIAGLLGGLGGLGGVGGIGASLLAGEASSPASEYMPVLESFDFTTRLIAGHGLEPHLRSRGWSPFGSDPADPEWARYREMHKRFDCEFSMQTGNLTLYYQDPDRAMAGKVLGFYISDLRELLRAEEIHDTTEAIASLREETKQTPDNLLQTQLHEMLARQIEQQKLAQVEADFAFKVLQAPTTPDKAYRPQALLDCVLAAILAALGLAAWAMLWSSSHTGTFARVGDRRA